ncbi:penicillin-binding protein 2 [Patescibacteria group bacterium]|nr:penicillin-binding protein 2 [Patescibacteria group bacterium]
MRSRFAFRVRLIAIGCAIIALILLVRLYDLQVVKGKEYRERAEAQYVKQSPNQVDRGSIFFTSKDGALISAAAVANGYTLSINPKLLKNPEEAYAALSKHVPTIERDAFMISAQKIDDTYEEVARRVKDEEGKAITALKIPGVSVLRETWRYYPGEELASHVVGFMGYGEGDTLRGQYGLERFYDDILAKTEEGLYVNFFADLFTNIRSEISDGEAPPGADLVISIEPSVQQHLEGVLTRYQKAWNPKTVGGIIMDPKTGAILAMAAKPDFDPNGLGDTNVSSLSNPLVESVYEFGSTMKPLTVAAGIDAGVVTPTSTYNDKGSATFDKSTIYNYDLKARGVVSMQEVLNQSLNTGVAHIVSKLGTQRFKEYFIKYGVTEETGIDLPNEESPLVSGFESPRTIEYVTASFGQGIALTPIAMTRALAVLANHGELPDPHVGVELDYGGGIKKKIGWSPERQAISPESAEKVTRMLVEVVDTSLKGGTVMIPEYAVAAKTGTAQIAKQGERGYYDDRYLHSFFGYFPAYEPKFIIFLFASEPKGAKFASETWTDPFMEAVKFLINYYNIPPDRPQYE